MNPWTLIPAIFGGLIIFIVIGLLIMGAVLEFGWIPVAIFLLGLVAFCVFASLFDSFITWWQVKETEWNRRHSDSKRGGA